MKIKDEIKILGHIKSKVSDQHGTLFNLYLSGSHLYGFNSKDSDIDLRGCFALNSIKFFELNKPKAVLDIVGLEEDHDIVLFELNKMVQLALKGNCNVLEEINASQIYKCAEFLKLRQLINNAFGKNGIYNSYKGLAQFNYKKFILNGRNTVKKYLYVFRGIMAGTYVLQTGRIQPNIEELNKHFKIPEVTKLIELKKNGLEKEPLRDLETGDLDKIIVTMFEKLDEAYLKSKIPEYPSIEDVHKIETFLKDYRKRGLE